MQALFLYAILILSGVFIVTALVGIFDESGKTTVVSIILFVLITIMFFVYGHVSNKCEKQPWVREDPYVTHTVMALQDGNEINGKIGGSRYCMSGYINEKFTYVYGYKTVGGGMKIQKAGEETTTVYFRDDITPCAKWYEETRSYWFVEETRYTCDIFVPTDSLEANITIDLK